MTLCCCSGKLAFVLVPLFQGRCLSHHHSCQEVQVSPVSWPGHCSHAELPTARLTPCCEVLGHLHTRNNQENSQPIQLEPAGSLRSGDDSALVVVVVLIYSTVTISPCSLNLLLPCYTTKCIADPREGAAYPFPNNSIPLPHTHWQPSLSLLCLALCCFLCISHPCWQAAPCWEGRTALEMLMAISHVF